mmetsp:Transcript_133864/g.428000  ORF Transcript_133864/g.428000 Transcript_133864/m.428000 type:complete len:233 (-) Transcript_133864:1434-2132(-)
MLNAKLAFLGSLPYSLARAREPAVAVACLKEYDSVGPHVSHHRVSEEFCNPAGDLRSDLEALATHSCMSRRLDAELRSLELIPISEEGAEGIHRDVRCTLVRAAASTPFWWATSMRLEENISMGEAFFSRGRATRTSIQICGGSSKWLARCPRSFHIGLPALRTKVCEVGCMRSAVGLWIAFRLLSWMASVTKEALQMTQPWTFCLNRSARVKATTRRMRRRRSTSGSLVCA